MASSYDIAFVLYQVRHIDRGINPSSVHEIYWTGEFLLKGLKIGVVAGLVALTVSNSQAPITLLGLG